MFRADSALGVNPPTAIPAEKWRADDLSGRSEIAGQEKLLAHVEPSTGLANEEVHKGQTFFSAHSRNSDEGQGNPVWRTRRKPSSAERILAAFLSLPSLVTLVMRIQRLLGASPKFGSRLYSMH